MVSQQIPKLLHSNEVRRTYFIAIISIVAVMILALLLFMYGPRVGQAISFDQAPVGQGGIFVRDGTEVVNNVVVVPVIVNIGDSQSTAFSVRLSYPQELSSPGLTSPNCGDSFLQSNLIFNRNTIVSKESLLIDGSSRCGVDDTGKQFIEFNLAWLCDPSSANCDNALTGQVELFRVPFTSAVPGTYEIVVDELRVLDLDLNGDELIQGTSNGRLTFVAEEVPAAEVPVSQVCEGQNAQVGSVIEDSVCAQRILKMVPEITPAVAPAISISDYTCRAVYRGVPILERNGQFIFVDYYTLNNVNIPNLVSTWSLFCNNFGQGWQPSSFEEVVRCIDVGGRGTNYNDINAECPAGLPSADNICGNLLLEPNEQCDDGNFVNDDGCSAQCTSEPQPDIEPQPDSDNDNIPDLQDVCPGFDDWLDADGDNIIDGCDNCPNDINLDQFDADADSVGDVCDNCQYLKNLNQADTDGDGIGDQCENIPQQIQPNIIELQLLRGDTTYQYALRDARHTIRATITPRANLADHLVITQVKYNGVTRTLFSERRDALQQGVSEVVEFIHEVPAVIAGPMEIDIFVWNQWPSDAGAWQSLIDEVRGNYEVTDN